MKLAICNELFEGWSYGRVFDYAAGLGFEAVELAPFTLAETVDDISPAMRRDIVKAAGDAGVEIAGLHWLLAKPAGFYINHPDKAIRRKTQDYLKKLIALCGELGGRALVHGSPGQRTVQEGWDEEESWNLARETWSVCAEAAEAAEVDYCLEALTTADTNFLTTFDQAIKMVDEIGSPRLQTMFDCRSISASATVPLPQALNAALKTGKVKHIHINDPNGRGPGWGGLEFAPLFRVILDHDFDGYASVEVFDFRPDPETIAARSAGYLHGVVQAIGGAAKSADFTK